MKRKIVWAMAAAIGITLLCGACNGTENNTSKVSGVESESSKEEISAVDKIEFLQFSEMKKGEEIAVIMTSLGEIEVRFFEEVAPLAVRNFIELAQSGYYNGMIVHKATNDFIQTGDPTGTGSGGESIYKDKDGNKIMFNDEFSKLAPHFYGALAMANDGAKNTNRSQFFIVANETVGKNTLTALEDQGYSKGVIDKYAEIGGLPHYDFEYTVFGCVIKGMDVVEKISATETYNDKPIEEIVIEKIEIRQYN